MKMLNRQLLAMMDAMNPNVSHGNEIFVDAR